MQVTPIPCLTDNYAYIISDNIYKIVGVVDPSEASPIITFLKNSGTSNKNESWPLSELISTKPTLAPQAFKAITISLFSIVG